ncbi:MAG: acyl-CoA dehydrogenase family protein [Thermodesulfobacteriota bacterium]|jgi:alkylation response protein AidB-like acyl-CoA dehydrogenase
MDFSMSEEQKAIQKAAREFTKGEFDQDLAREYERIHKFPFEIWQKACKLGFIGIHFPEVYGGQGLGVFEKILVTEEFCRKDSSIGIALSLSDYGSEIILRFGNENQKEIYLAPLAQGKAVSSCAFAESGCQDDFRRISTKVVSVSDGYLIQGEKTFVINGTIAQYLVVLCQTDLDNELSLDGHCNFVVENDIEGLKITESGDKLGIRMISTAGIIFDDVKVPVTNLVGRFGQGLHQIRQFQTESNIVTAGQALGIAEGAFDRAVEYARNREQFGHKIGAFQVIRHKLADMACGIELARLLAYLAAWNFDTEVNEPKINSMAKMLAAENVVRVVTDAIQIFGGYGYTADYELERFYRDAWITEIHGGSGEIQRDNIADIIVGKLK